jgi:hypothetical protein
MMVANLWGGGGGAKECDKWEYLTFYVQNGASILNIFTSKRCEGKLINTVLAKMSSTSWKIEGNRRLYEHINA